MLWKNFVIEGVTYHPGSMVISVTLNINLDQEMNAIPHESVDFYSFISLEAVF